jgi:hypothetical protein
MTLPLRRRVIVPVLTLLTAFALAAGIIPGLVSASAAPATAVAARAATQDRGTGLGTAGTIAELTLDKVTAARAALSAQRARARAFTAAMTYTVRAGDSLSDVARARCGQARMWTGIYAASRARHWTAGNANVLTAGQHLWLACAYLPSMLRYAPAPPPPPVIRTVTRTVSASTGSSRVYHRSYRRAYTASSTYHGSGSMESCIISRESGGSSQVMNSSGHYGLYQFSAGTWAASGGSPADFGHASVAEQRRVFQNAVAARGYSDWTPYDGC